MCRWTPSSSTDAGSGASVRHLTWFGVGALLVAVAVLYGRALGYPFVYDDRVLLEGNVLLGDWSRLGEALGHDLFHGTGVRGSPYWRPVVTFSYFLDHTTGAGAPWAFHLTNLVLLVSVGALLARLLTLHHAPWPWLLALLWVVLPVQVEAACNITGRTDLLAAAFALAALGARRPWVAATCLALALGSKEVALTVPVAAWLLRPADRRLVAMVATCIGWLGARHLVLSGVEVAAADAGGGSLASWGAVGAHTMWTLLGLVDLRRVAGMEVPEHHFLGLGWLALALAVAALVVHLRQRAPLAAAGFGLALASAGLVSGTASAALRWGDTLLLLPSVGVVLAAGSLSGGRVKWALAGLGVLASVFAVGRVERWSSEEALWRTAHATRPDDARLRLNLARALVGISSPEGFGLLVGVEHDDPRIAREIAATRAFHLLELGRAEEALPNLLAARADDPEAAWPNVMACVLLPPAHPEAIPSCELAASVVPDEPSVWEALERARAAAD